MIRNESVNFRRSAAPFFLRNIARAPLEFSIGFASTALTNRDKQGE
jgi:hypothetical protein